jgi:hypothetical protein
MPETIDDLGDLNAQLLRDSLGDATKRGATS